MSNYLLFNLILLTLFFSLAFLNYYLFKSLPKKSDDIFQYKIKNLGLSKAIMLSYIGFFVIFLYGLRIYNLPREIDVKKIVKDIYIVREFMYSYPVFTIIVIITFIMLLVLFLLLFVKVYSIITRHIFNIWLFYYYPDTIGSSNSFTRRLKDTLSRMRHDDVILFMLYQISRKITLWLDNGDWKKTNHSWYRIDAFINEMFTKLIWNKRYQLFVTLSPLIIILYDCIFNNFIVTHVFYYLLLYVPIILLRKITINLATESGYICDLLWDIFYKKETCIYAISQKDEKLLKFYMLSGLRQNVDLGLEAEMYLKEVTRFTLNDAARNEYVNFLGNTLIKHVNGKYYEELYDNNGRSYEGEVWILLSDKTYHTYSTL